LRATHSYLEEILARIFDRLDKADWSNRLAYFIELAVYHEDMHGEAFWQSRQSLSYAAPAIGVSPHAAGEALTGDAEIQGGLFLLGARPNAGFVFDNEKWAHEIALQPFEIGRTPVTNEQFIPFVEDAGYRRRELWSDDGWMWRGKTLAECPAYWKRRDGGWWMRRFDQQMPLPEHLPVMHVNWYEADAWCRWAGRRLPVEAEWERAAAGGLDYRYPWGNTPPDLGRANLDGHHDGPAPVSAYAGGDSESGCRQMMGNVWEWTADWLHPYPGFTPDPYADYSLPWFGNQKALRGGSFATRSRMIRNSWRNFFAPDRRDLFAGFRTCAR
jgi:iron(II)-dependent oxidoreductase